MRKTIRCFVAVMTVLLAVMIFAGAASAQDAKFDSDTISGLGARNIGSAAMSGRVAAIAAMAAQRSSQFSTRRLRNPLAP